MKRHLFLRPVRLKTLAGSGLRRGVLVLVAGLVSYSAALVPVVSAEPAHLIRYVVTATEGREVTIHFRVGTQTENWSGTHSENFWVSPDEPWQRTVELAEPQSAYVSVRNVWWNPDLGCEIWVDGNMIMKGTGVCIPRLRSDEAQ